MTNSANPSQRPHHPVGTDTASASGGKTRICFIENREKTSFWVKVAEGLAVLGYEITWIVQNPVFAPPAHSGPRVDLPFPTASQLEDIGIPDAVITDRGRSYFQGGADHYKHYQTQIIKALDQLRPDCIIGEPTLFHELLTIAACKERAIPYLHPMMTRYPEGRFNIFKDDTQIPSIASHDPVDGFDLPALSVAIATGKTLPTYMDVPGKLEMFQRRLKRARALAKTLWGRWRGERYNTPSLAVKLQLGRQHRINTGRWAKLARMPDATQPAVLYPLQMQPEANIEVWGRPYSDQLAVIKEMLSAMPDGGQILVKANPKSKYEVSNALLDLAEGCDRIVLLPFETPMIVALEMAIGAVTVTGTIGFEAVFGKGRCISLRHPVLKEAFPEFSAETPAAAVRILLEDQDAGRGNTAKGEKLLARFVAESFPGTINEPLFDPSCIEPENIAAVAKALHTAIQKEVR